MRSSASGAGELFFILTKEKSLAISTARLFDIGVLIF